MRLRPSVIVSVCALGAVVAGDAQSVPGPTVHIGASPDSRIVITPVGATGPAGSLLSGQFGGLAPASFYLTNLGKPILAVVTVYNFVSQSGQAATGRIGHSGFMNIALPPVIPMNSQVLMAFSQMIPVGQITSPSPPFVRAAQLDMQRISTFASLYIQVDCVIFSDGEVVGEDTSGYVEELAAMRTAASTVRTLAKSAQSAGVPFSDALSSIVTRPTRRSDKVAVWEQRFARQIVLSHTPQSVITYLSQLPVGPKLFNTTTGGTP